MRKLIDSYVAASNKRELPGDCDPFGKKATTLMIVRIVGSRENFIERNPVLKRLPDNVGVVWMTADTSTQESIEIVRL